MRANSMPGRATSTVKRIAPVTLALPLRRGYGLPMTASSAFGGSGGGSPAGTCRASSARLTPTMPMGNVSVRNAPFSAMGSALSRFGGGERRRDDMGVATAPADVAADRPLDLLRRRICVPLQKRRRAHRHTRGAEAALHRVVLDEGFLDRVKLIAAR